MANSATSRVLARRAKVIMLTVAEAEPSSISAVAKEAARRIVQNIAFAPIRENGVTSHIIANGADR